MIIIIIIEGDFTHHSLLKNGSGRCLKIIRLHDITNIQSWNGMASMSIFILLLYEYCHKMNNNNPLDKYSCFFFSNQDQGSTNVVQFLIPYQCIIILFRFFFRKEHSHEVKRSFMGNRMQVKYHRMKNRLGCMTRLTR